MMWGRHRQERWSDSDVSPENLGCLLSDFAVGTTMYYCECRVVYRWTRRRVTEVRLT